MSTVATPATLRAPNLSELADDSVDGIVGRVLARIAAHGAGVQGVYTDGWVASSRVDILSSRTWEVDVVDAAGSDEAMLEAEVIGRIVVSERRERYSYRPKGASWRIVDSVRTVYRVGFANDERGLVRARIDWKA